MDLEEWAEQQRREMIEMWDENWREAAKPGVELTTSPVHEDPKLLTLGFNPGSDDDKTLHEDMYQFLGEDGTYNPETDSFGFGDIGWLADDTVDTTSPVYPRFRQRICKGKIEILKKTIETNRYVARSNGKSGHDDFLSEVDDPQSYKNFCFNWVEQLIRRTEPEVIIEYAGASDTDWTAVELFSEVYGLDTEVHREIDLGDNDGKRITALCGTAGPSKFISLDKHLSTPAFSGYWVKDPHLKNLEEKIPPLLPEP